MSTRLLPKPAMTSTALISVSAALKALNYLKLTQIPLPCEHSKRKRLNSHYTFHQEWFLTNISLHSKHWKITRGKPGTLKQTKLKTNMNNPCFRNTRAEVWKHLGHWVGSAKLPTTHFSKCMAQASQQPYSTHAQAPQATKHLQHLTANYFQITSLSLQYGRSEETKDHPSLPASAPPLSHRVYEREVSYNLLKQTMYDSTVEGGKKKNQSLTI